MDQSYHLLSNGRQSGPFTVAELQQMLASGRISPNQLAWRPGLTGWAPVGSVVPPPLPGSRPLPGTPALPPSPPPLPASAFRLSTLLKWAAGVAVLVIGMIGFGVWFVVSEVRKAGTDAMAFRPLLEDRSGHTPAWRSSNFEAAGPADVPADRTFELIRYPAAGGLLAAYVTPDPGDGQRHPAVVWAHGGFGGIGRHFWEPCPEAEDQSARVFREKGIVMMCPSWRGENDNPGRFELFYGEVDDLLAAVAHVKSLPYVDPDRVYLAGHSTGGTLVLLAAGATDAVRAVFSLGGMVDGVATLSGEGYGNTPYDPGSMRDHRLRSPLRYAAFLKRPTFYFEGADDYDADTAASMKRRARGMFHPFPLPGDHFDIVHPVTSLIAEKILADTGPACAIQFSEAELVEKYNAAYTASLAKRLAEWAEQAGDLEEWLGQADPDDLVARSEADVSAVVSAIDRVLQGAQAPEKTAGSLAALAGLRDEIEDEAVFGVFDARVTTPLIQWLGHRMEQPGDVPEAEGKSLVALLAAVCQSRLEPAADLVRAAVRGGRLPDDHGWNDVFRAFDKEHPLTSRVMEGFADDPPGGLTGVLLLDAANDLCFSDWSGPHPFSNAQGAARLREWLESTDPQRLSYAHSAAFGLGFIRGDLRADLLPLALNHTDRTIRLEGAWADLKHGGSQGLARLQEACRDVHQSDRAQDYLKELGREADIPAAARDPAFTAMAALSRWLQHPNELDGDPLTLEVYDTRSLHWPPTDDQRRLWLIRFTYRHPDQADPKIAYGCVGSMTWSSFEAFPEAPRPEALYLRQCALEMGRSSGRSEKDIMTGSALQRALDALRAANPGVFDDPSLGGDAGPPK